MLWTEECSNTPTCRTASSLRLPARRGPSIRTTDQRVGDLPPGTFLPGNKEKEDDFNNIDHSNYGQSINPLNQLTNCDQMSFIWLESDPQLRTSVHKAPDSHKFLLLDSVFSMGSVVGNCAQKIAAEIGYGFFDHLICSRWMVTDFVFWFSNWHFRNSEAHNIPLKRSWKYISNSILHALKLFRISIAKCKKKICSCLATANQAGQKNRSRYWLRFFWA